MTTSLVDQAICWRENRLELLDQRKLPHSVEYVICNTVDDVIVAIRDMIVRGAPAIGIAAAYGAVLSIREHYKATPKAWRQDFEHDLVRLAEARPTAVNLQWAVDRMRKLTANISGPPEPIALREAIQIHEADIKANHLMGQIGTSIITEPCSVITHCNAGALATGGYGTALGVIRAAYKARKIDHVFVGETRPWFQGARLTAWEMQQEGVPATLFCDSAAASLMRSRECGWVIVGADRVATNGDVANKIGTYSLAVLAKQHGVKFMVVAPTSTFDLSLPNGDSIKIETRAEDEVRTIHGRSIAHGATPVWNPVFDITPSSLIDVLVTEKGAIEQPTREKIRTLMRDSN